MTVDIHKVVETDQTIRDLHADAEVFPPAVEFAFRYLQVCIPLHTLSVLLAIEACCCIAKLLLSQLVDTSYATVVECMLATPILQHLHTPTLLCH